MQTWFLGFGAFLGISALVIMTPGPDTALVIRNTLWGGRRGGILTALGVVTGQATWATASGLGLTALLLASGPAFALVRFAGAAYLLFLGARSLHHALTGSQSAPAPAAGTTPPLLEAQTAFRQGLLSALGNPKLAAFFVSLFPQFVPHGPRAPVAILIFSLTFCFMTMAWLAAYATVVARAGRFLEQSGVARTLEALLGATLIALGLRVASEGR